MYTASDRVLNLQEVIALALHNCLFSCDVTKEMLQCTMGTRDILIPGNEDSDMRNSWLFQM